MGGVMSGWRWSKKQTVEGCYAIDTADLKRLKLLVPGPGERRGTLRWMRSEEQRSEVSYEATIGEEAGTLRLSYKMVSTNENVEYPVQLVTTPCYLGGVRWWFVCPLVCRGVRCGRRMRKLYLAGRYFGCRHCHGLTYTSTQQSDARVYAALRAGVDLDRFGDVENMSISQLGFALKVLAFQQKRLDRFLRQSAPS